MIWIFSFILIWSITTYITHCSMSASTTRQPKEKIKWARYSDFKREFYKVQWERDIKYKHSFFNLDKLHFLDFFDKNIIHAGIVIVNGKQFIFRPYSYLLFRIFLFKNRTTLKNYKNPVNAKKEIRKIKLKKLEK